MNRQKELISLVVFATAFLAEGAVSLQETHSNGVNECFTIPTRLGRFRMLDWRDQDTTSLDTAYRFRGGRRTDITVKISPIANYEQIGDDPQIWVDMAAEQIKSTLDSLTESGTYAEYYFEFSEPSPLEMGDSVIPGHLTVLGRFPEAGNHRAAYESARSEMHLFVIFCGTLIDITFVRPWLMEWSETRIDDFLILFLTTIGGRAWRADPETLNANWQYPTFGDLEPMPITRKPTDDFAQIRVRPETIVGSACFPNGVPRMARQTTFLHPFSMEDVQQAARLALRRNGRVIQIEMAEEGCMVTSIKTGWPPGIAGRWRTRIEPATRVALFFEPEGMWTKTTVGLILVVDPYENYQHTRAGDFHPLTIFEYRALGSTPEEIRTILEHGFEPILTPSCRTLGGGDPKIDFCEAAAKRFPDDPIRYVDLAESHLEFYHATEGWGAIRRVLEMENYPETRVLFFGDMLERYEHYGQMLRLYREASARHPNSFEIIFRYAGLLAESKDHELALEFFRRAEALNDSGPDLQFYIGRESEVLGDTIGAGVAYATAYERYSSVLEERAEEVDVWLALTRIAVFHHLHIEAVSLFARALIVDPTFPDRNPEMVELIRESYELAGEQPPASVPCTSQHCRN